MAYPSYEDVQTAVKHLTAVRMNRWLNHELFSPQWWFLVLTFVIPLIVWWKFVDKKRLLEITLFTVVTAVVITILDAAGTELTLWGYRYRLIPFFPILSEYDYSGLPVVYALIYQWLPRWKSFFFAMIVLSVIYSFCAEPLFIWWDIYKPNTWSSLYSFPCYILIGVSSKWLLEKIMKAEVTAAKAR